jgi:tripartite-type tricarboxylate transporter receptor subunit TctC
MLIGYAPGGGTDAFGRVLATYLAKHLPGQPSIIVKNMPGANGITGLNYVLSQTKADGMTVITGTNSQMDPVNYRRPQSRYTPNDFIYLGGATRGGYGLVIRSDAVKRLHDKNAKPVVMGSKGARPNPAMQVTVWGIEILGWNARWVTGYRSTKEIMLALERGEVDMTATGNLFLLKKMLSGDKYKLVTQSGSLQDGEFMKRPDFGNVPVFANLVKAKMSNPMTKSAFDYWLSLSTVDKFLALKKGTPGPTVAAYRKALNECWKDPAFMNAGKKISKELAPMAHEDLESLIVALANTKPDTMEYMGKVFAKQGIQAKK